MNSELLQQVRVLDPVSGMDQVCDVLISDRQIEAIAAQLPEYPEETAILDCQGLVLAPGLVDLYSYSGEPGHEDRETLTALAAAGAAGGFTRLTILPNTVPPIDNPAGVSLVRQKASAIAPFPDNPITPTPHLQFWGGLTLGIEGTQMTELAELAQAGVIGFTDGRAIENLGLLRRLLEYLKPLNKPVAVMASDRQLRGNGTMREGKLSIRYGLPGNPAISETAALAAILEVIAAVGTPVHLMRISTARGVELIANAKSRGLPITASTTWMHLLLETKALSSYDPSLRLNPPLGNPSDRMALVEGVKNGVIDAIAIDHIAYTYEEKTVAFSEAPSGAIGLELALPLLWQTFVETGEWTALQLWQALSLSPQKCLYQEPTRCQVGDNAELVLFDPQKTWTVNAANLKSMGENTPWFNNLLTGKVVRTWNH